GDQVYIYQQYTGNTGHCYSSIYFTTVKVDQPKIPDAEYQALVDFYNAMNGSKWNNKWDTSANNLHEGPWYGVSIQNGHVTGINLNNTSNVIGAIPASLGNLKFLKSLSLYGGSYTKNLSATDIKIISELESLESLDLRYCKLKGVIPASWGKLNDLKTLYLSNNNIEDIDEALVGLPLLKTVDFTSQTITIPIIEVGANELIIDLPTLSTMVFNTDGGSINNTNYFTLYINGVNKAANYSNKEGKLIFKDAALLGIKLTDKIKIIQNDGAAQATTINYTTVTFGKPLVDEEFEILKKFYASTNGEQWTKKWDISQNKLHEVSWYGVGTKEGHVVSLSLAGNNLSGTLPEELSGLRYLETLNLQSNAIEGNIPANLGQLSALKTIYLQANKLEGSLPTLSGITGLKKLSIAYNQFKGAIPAQFNDFQNIEQLDVSNNGFDALETAFTYDLNNVFLNLRNQTITKDEYLYLKGDEISIELPSITTYNEINQDYSGKYLFALQANNFKIAEATPEGNTLVFSNITIADIPAGAKITIWQRTGASQGSYLHYNGIADGSETPLLAEEYDALVAFFEQAGGANWTEPWDITTNNLHEKRWKGVTTNDGHIVAINLSDNNLTGSISSELGKFTELQTLNLTHNKLTGSIPEELSQLAKLKSIDFSENELTDMSTTFPANVKFKLDRQKIDLGALPLTINALIKDKKINHYDHTNVQFSTSQSYNMTLKDNYKMLTVSENGFKLMNVMSEWNIPNNQTMELRQIAGSARNSVLTYTLTYREGDSNLDGIVNILDIQSSLNYMLNQKPTYFNYGAADINKDKKLNLLDVILLINKIQDGSLEKATSTKKMMASNDEKVALSIEEDILYIDNPTETTAAFDIRLKGVNKEQVKELLSGKGYTVSVAEKGEEISIIGFSMSETLSGKLAIAKVSPKTTIVSAMLSNDTATEVPYKIVNATLGIDDNTISDKISGITSYPNPFKEQTTIQYQLLENATQVVLKVYNMQGQIVRVQSNLETSEGIHQQSFVRQELASGVYFYTVEIQNSKDQKVYKGKMLIQ
ncbi:leucine-rich repeat domain-containing protein, partial [Flavobacterium sp. ALJ2]|uniref:leucine-rich repeat domain-containing protein n=1 Tax=Flavobacterium sp. ALJ2 TaxID=2786960 RepID=UPI00189DBE10